MMEQYQVTLYSQMGPRHGKLTLQYDKGQVTGSLELVGYSNPIHGTRNADGKLCLFHAIRTIVSTLPCETILEISGNQLAGETHTQPCRMRWEGWRAGKEQENPMPKEPKL